MHTGNIIIIKFVLYKEFIHSLSYKHYAHNTHPSTTYIYCTHLHNYKTSFLL